MEGVSTHQLNAARERYSKQLQKKTKELRSHLQNRLRPSLKFFVNIGVPMLMT
jgi:hypothetical protein